MGEDRSQRECIRVLNCEEKKMPGRKIRDRQAWNWGIGVNGRMGARQLGLSPSDLNGYDRVPTQEKVESAYPSNFC
jgi:hypothetical protein